MKAVSVFVILLLCIILFSGLTMIIYPFLTYHEVREIPMQIKVGDRLGFNTDQEILNFGTNMPGNINRRFMVIEYPQDTLVRIEIKGEIAAWTDISSNNFILNPGDKQDVTFSVMIPRDAEQGLYEGKAVIHFKKMS